MLRRSWHTGAHGRQTGRHHARASRRGYRRPRGDPSGGRGRFTLAARRHLRSFGRGALGAAGGPRPSRGDGPVLAGRDGTRPRRNAGTRGVRADRDGPGPAVRVGARSIAATARALRPDDERARAPGTSIGGTDPGRTWASRPAPAGRRDDGRRHAGPVRHRASGRSRRPARGIPGRPADGVLNEGCSSCTRSRSGSSSAT